MPTYAVWQGLAAKESGGAISALVSPTVTVTDKTTGDNATLFEDRDGAVGLANPFTAGADGSIEFYVKPGRYKITATKGGDTVIWEDVLVGTLHGVDQPADGEFVVYDGTNGRFARKDAAAARAALGLGSAAEQDVGAAVGDVVQLEDVGGGTPGLPAVDGSQLTGISPPASSETTPGVVEKATQAEVEAETADKNVTADNAKHHPGVAKAWVAFDGTGTIAIIESHNVSSLTDEGTGDYTVNLDITMANAPYCIVPGAKWFSSGRTTVAHIREGGGTTTTTSFRLTVVQTSNSGGAASQTDVELVTAAVFGGLA